MRLILALLSSALTAAVLQILADLAPGFPQSLARLHSVFGLLVSFFLLAAVAALFLGLPAFLIAKHLKLANIWMSAMAGIVVGGLIYSLVLILPSMPFEDGSEALGAIDLIRNYLQFGGIGLLSGLVFWLVRNFKHRKKAPAQDAF